MKEAAGAAALHRSLRLHITVNSRKKISLTEFLDATFVGENAK
jgi:hypothetical protein